MRLKRSFQVYHTVLFHHRTDGGDSRIMAVIGIGYRSEGDNGAFLESLQFVLKYIETDLQMVGIYNTKQRLARYGSPIEHSIELGHHA